MRRKEAEGSVWRKRGNIYRMGRSEMSVKEQFSKRTACWEDDRTGGADRLGRIMVRVT